MSATVPRGPELLALAVRELQLGRSSQHRLLTGETARRYFSGEPVKSDTENSIFRAVATALLELGYLEFPQLPPPLPGTSVDALASALCRIVHRWDAYVGVIRSFAAPVEHPELLATFLRQLVIDVALRWAAVGELAQRAPPPLLRPEWADESGWDAPLHELKGALTRDGDERHRATWEKVSEELGFETRKSLENWLYAGSRPGEKSIEDLAAVFATVGGAPAKEQEIRLRRHWGLATLARAIAGRVGWATVGDLADALIRYTIEVRRRLRESRAPRERLTNALWATVVVGIDDPTTRELVKLLHNHEPHEGWAADLKGVIDGGQRRLHWVARTVAHHETGRARAMAEGIPTDVFDAALTLTARLGPGADLRLAASLPVEARQMLLDSLDVAADFAGSAAEMERERGDLLAAVELFRLAARLAPDSSDAHFRLGAALMTLGMLDEARAELEISARLDPNNYLPQVEIGVLHLERGDTSTALEHLRRVARTFPGELLATYQLAIAQLRSGLFEDALASCERVLEVQPYHARALLTAAACAKSAGNAKKARAYEKRAAAFGLKPPRDETA